MNGSPKAKPSSATKDAARGSDSDVLKGYKCLPTLPVSISGA